MTWRSIKDDPPPKDGTWFVIWTHGQPEVGCYNPLMWRDYEPAGDGLYRAIDQKLYDWSGFNNFHAATHWMPLPAPPEGEEGRG